MSFSGLILAGNKGDLQKRWIVLNPDIFLQTLNSTRWSNGILKNIVISKKIFKFQIIFLKKRKKNIIPGRLIVQKLYRSRDV